MCNSTHVGPHLGSIMHAVYTSVMLYTQQQDL